MAAKSTDVDVNRTVAPTAPASVPVDRSTPMQALHGRIDSVFDDFARGRPQGWLRGEGHLFFKDNAPAAGAAAIGAFPTIKVEESGDAYEISPELPGMDEKDVGLTLGHDIQAH